MPRRRTQEEFEQEVLKKIGPDYKVLGKYINKDTKIEMIHYSCGNTFMKNPHDVISKSSGCPYCNGNQLAKYTEQWVKEHTQEPYIYIKGFTKMTDKCTFYCNKCQIFFQQTPSKLINQKIYGCDCCPAKKKTHEQFLQELGPDCLEHYEILSPYINCETPIEIKHKDCETIFKITPYAFIHKNKKCYCPVCFFKKSKGENKISEYLAKNGFSFQREFSFPDLKKRRFDFFLPELGILIEYDGSQHYNAVKFFGGEEELKKTQMRDKEKNEQALKNGYMLFRIPYYDIDFIPQVLHKILKEKSSTTIEKYLVTEQSRKEADAFRNG